MDEWDHVVPLNIHPFSQKGNFVPHWAFKLNSALVVAGTIHQRLIFLAGTLCPRGGVGAKLTLLKNEK
jgi:hypothetical protein